MLEIKLETVSTQIIHTSIPIHMFVCGNRLAVVFCLRITSFTDILHLF